MRSWTSGLKASATCLMALCLSSCASVSESDLRAEVAPLIDKDQVADRTMAHLEKAGFICAVGDPPDVECSRNRSPNPLVSCIQRVILVDARLKNVFTSVAYRPPACFGGFG